MNPPPKSFCEVCVRETVTRIQAYVGTLRRRLSPEQIASADEEWELICERNGWPLPAPSGVAAPLEKPLPPRPAEDPPSLA